MLRYSKTFICLVVFLVLAVAVAGASAVCLSPPADLNADGGTTVVDIQCGILVVLWEQAASDPAQLPDCIQGDETRGDANCDGSVTVADVQISIAITLGLALSPDLDPDGDLCPSACEFGCEKDPSVCDDGNPCTTNGCAPAQASASTCDELGWGSGFGTDAVCAQSDGVLGCVGLVDWDTAKGACEGVGARLCTYNDLALNETRGTGCGYDSELVWSSTSCGPDAYYVGPGNVENTGPLLAPDCLPKSAANVAVRCCADVDPAQAANQCTATPQIAADCADANNCTADFCEPGTGCVNELFCDDGVGCTVDSCDEAANVCVNVPNDANCDDGIGCTNNICDADLGCVFTPDDTDCTDACTSGTCELQPSSDCCASNSTPNCADTVCRDLICDGDPFCCDSSWDFLCSTAAIEQCDVCQPGCQPTETTDCDDSIACTIDSCDPVTGCMNTPDDGACDDGVDCTADSCDAALGCVNTPDDGTCNDGIECTNDVCDAAADCQNLTIDADCDDGIDCTSDVCDPALGCTNTPSNSACDDGVDCTSDVCDAALGCTNTPNNSECDDSNVCTDDSCLVIATSGSSCPELGWTTVVGDVCGESEIPAGSSNCSGALDLEAAGAFCEAGGARLCTLDELEGDVTFNTGCGYNTVRIWSSTACAPGSVFTAAGSSNNAGAFPTECTPVDSGGVFARCCADVDPSAIESGCVSTPNTVSCDDGNACTTAQCGIKATSTATCSELSADWATNTNGSAEICGESDASELGGECSGEQPWADAEAFCATGGARLCTVSELEADEASGTGCQYDSERIWSATPCSEGAYWTAAGANTNSASVPTQCTPVGAAGVVTRCCADADTTAVVAECQSEAADVCDDGNDCTTDLCDPSDGSCTFPASNLGCDDGNACTTATCTQPTPSALSCSELGWSIGNDGSTAKCGESDGAGLGCQRGDATEAAAICESVGARLCTVNEALANEAEGTGCNYDFELVWTSSACDGGQWAVVGDVNVDEAGDSPARCLDASLNLAIRCCADVNPGAVAPTCMATTSDCAAGTLCAQTICDPDTGCSEVVANENCCSAKSNPTCGNSDTCNSCVCGLDPSCCTAAWDSACGALANDQCAAQCGCGTIDNCDGNACTSGEQCEAGVCEGATPISCNDGDGCTSNVCDDGTGCDTSVAGASNCCGERNGSGCEEAACEACVCAQDNFCCTSSWDNFCVECATGSGDGFNGACADDPCVTTCECPDCDDGNVCTVEACGIPAVSALNCADLGWGAGNGTAQVCAESDGAALGDCSGVLTQSAAATFCEAAGARLCTVDEMIGSETEGTGCSYDFELVWTSSPCENGFWLAAGNGTNLPMACASPEQAHVARCCADVDPVAVAVPGCLASGSACTDDDCSLDVCDPTTGCSTEAKAGDCCSTGTAGCSNPVCEACVCALDSFCCSNSWDDLCVECATGSGDGVNGACELATCAALCQCDALACDDNSDCTTNDVCQVDGICAGQGDGSCDDGIDCTVDICLSDGGCDNVPADGLCEDGDPTTNGVCDPDFGCIQNTP